MEQIGGISAVTMDWWDTYISSIREHVPEADGKIVFDKFHLAAPAFGRCRGQSTADGGQDPEGCRGRPLGGDVLRLAGGIRAAMEPKDRKEFAELRISELKTARAC